MIDQQGSFRGEAVELRGVTHAYGDAVALHEVSLAVGAGEFLTLLGPSGSGKTTTLSLLAGFLHPTGGRILVGGRDVTELPAHKRGVGMVFQNYALFPHMTVLQNVCFPLKVRRMNRREAVERARSSLEIVQLEGYTDRYPRQLSGGQQQRVALARALVYEPPVLLMDEPFGALDRRLRTEMQLSLRELHRRLGVTIIFVTHDQEEALTLSDRVCLMHEGRVEQAGSPRELYERPSTEFVAGFMGTSNVLAAETESVEGGLCRVRTASGATVTVTESAMPGGSDRVKLVIRPERIRILEESAAGEYDNVLVGDVDDVIFLGDGNNYLVRIDTSTNLLVKDVNRGQRPSGRVLLGWRAEDVIVLPDGGAGEGRRVEAGSTTQDAGAEVGLSRLATPEGAGR